MLLKTKFLAYGFFIIFIYNIYIMELYNSDCIEGIKKIPNNSIDFVFADLPFGCTSCSWDLPIDMAEFSKQIWRITKDEAPIVFMCNMKFLFEIIKYMKTDYYKFEVIWEKANSTQPFLAKKRVMSRHEFICFWYKKQPKVYTRNIKKYHSETIPQKKFIRKQGKMYDTAKCGEQTFDYKKRLPKSIQKFKLGFKNRINSTQKPLELCEWLLKYWTEPGSKVLDATMGSGTMAHACKKMVRKFIGFEIDKKQYDYVLQRLKDEKV